MNEVPSAAQWCELALNTAHHEMSFSNKEMWDAKAPSYRHKQQRSGYLSQLLDMLDLQSGETVFDMGCGPGVLSVPLARAGHEVYAVDFSDGMLAELSSAAEAAGVRDKIHTFKRAWQEDWDGLPVADVALSSRSMTTRDFADAVSKLESKARRRVIVTTSAGEAPWLDVHVRRALGRNENEVTFAEPFVMLLNYLLQSGRFPSVTYIVTDRTPSSTDARELKEYLHGCAQVQASEEELFEQFFEEHLTTSADGRAQMDYEQRLRWAVISWEIV